MWDINKICLGCMREREDEKGPCPYCGFDLKNYSGNSRWLPPGHILNGKYILGKVLGEGGFGITYIGSDLNLVYWMRNPTTYRLSVGGTFCFVKT